MARLPTSLLATAAALAATPALAQERAVDVNVPAARLDQANRAETNVRIGVVQVDEDLLPALVLDGQPCIHVGKLRGPFVDEREDHHLVDEVGA